MWLQTVCKPTQAVCPYKINQSNSLAAAVYVELGVFIWLVTMCDGEQHWNFQVANNVTVPSTDLWSRHSMCTVPLGGQAAGFNPLDWLMAAWRDS